MSGLNGKGVTVAWLDEEAPFDWPRAWPYTPLLTQAIAGVLHPSCQPASKPHGTGIAPTWCVRTSLNWG